MSRLSDMAVIRDYEERWLDPDNYEDDIEDEEIWNKADDEAEERWLERWKDGK